MNDPIYKKHLEYARSHNSQACKNFLTVAAMYMRHADQPTLGVLQGVATALEQEMALDAARTTGAAAMTDDELMRLATEAATELISKFAMTLEDRARIIADVFREHFKAAAKRERVLQELLCRSIQAGITIGKGDSPHKAAINAAIAAESSTFDERLEKLLDEQDDEDVRHGEII